MAAGERLRFPAPANASPIWPKTTFEDLAPPAVLVVGEEWCPRPRGDAASSRPGLEASREAEKPIETDSGAVLAPLAAEDIRASSAANLSRLRVSPDINIIFPLWCRACVCAWGGEACLGARRGEGVAPTQEGGKNDWCGRRGGTIDCSLMRKDAR